MMRKLIPQKIMNLHWPILKLLEYGAFSFSGVNEDPFPNDAVPKLVIVAK